MSGGRKPIYHMLGVGIVIGVVLGLALSGTLDPLLAPSVSAPTGKPRTSTEPYSSSDPNVVMVDAEQAQRFMIAPVRLREFRDERTAVGRIAFNDERTTSVFAPFQGRVLRLIAKPGDVLYPGSPLLVIDSPDLVQANADLISASVAVRKAENQLSLAERVVRRQKLLYEAGAGAFKDLEQTASAFMNAQHDLKRHKGRSPPPAIGCGLRSGRTMRKLRRSRPPTKSIASRRFSRRSPAQ